MRYRLVLFDFDGTLADSFGWFLGAVNAVAERHRFRPVAAEEVESLRGRGARQVMAHLGVPAWKLPAIARHMRRLMAREIDRIPLFPGVGDLLAELAGRGVAVAVVSSNAAANVRRVLGPERAACVRHLACGAALFGKPAKLRAVVRRSGVPAAAALCVGDELRDREAARAAGLAFGAVAWGYTRPEALRAAAPEEFFADVAALRARLLDPEGAGPG